MTSLRSTQRAMAWAPSATVPLQPLRSVPLRERLLGDPDELAGYGVGRAAKNGIARAQGAAPGAFQLRERGRLLLAVAGDAIGRHRAIDRHRTSQLAQARSDGLGQNHTAAASGWSLAPIGLSTCDHRAAKCGVVAGSGHC